MPRSALVKQTAPAVLVGATTWALAYARGVGNWPDIVTPRDIAARLGIRGERPDKALRAWLREIHPDHVRYRRWELTPAEADQLVERWRCEYGLRGSEAAQSGRSRG